MKILLLLFILSVPVFTESPFHTEIVITSPYLSTIGYGGARRNNVHKGMDCHALNYYPVIFPIMNGTVIEVDWDDIYGKYVIMKSKLEDGTVLFHKYAHGKLIYYAASGEIDVNTPIMIIGSTGYSDSPHLHLEVWEVVNGEIKYHDPEGFL